MNISETVDNVVQYILRFIEKAKGYIEDIIEFFSDLRDRLETFLEYIEEKLQSITGVIEDLKQHAVEAA
jgi:hypothetical protein